METNRPRRASQRIVVSIDLADTALRHLMTKQCKSRGCYITAYRGSSAELRAAGVPDTAFPNGARAAKFQVQTVNVCCTGSCELLTGSMRVVDTGRYELEIDWGFVRPYMQGAHPAVCELARMLLKDVLAWTTTDSSSNTPDLTQPIDMLAVDPRAVDYKPRPGMPRLQVTPAFHKELRGYASRLFEMVHSHCEVLPVSASAAEKAQQRPALRIVTKAGHLVEASHG